MPAYDDAMPRPLSDREKWQEERLEVIQKRAEYQSELETTLMKHKSRRQFLDWQIRRMTLRLAELEKRLAALDK